jgi:hypothetical protein
MRTFGVGIVAIGAADAGGVHPALGERAELVDLAVDLPVTMVQAAAQGGRQALVKLRMARRLAVAQGLPAAVAKGALLDLALAAERLEVDDQPFTRLTTRGFCPGPVDMRLAGAMAALAAHGRLLPGAGEAVLLVVVVLEQPGGMAVGAHGVPVLVAAGPMQRVVRCEALAGVKENQRCPPWAGGRLSQARVRPAGAPGQRHQVLLQWLVAEGM